MKKTGSAMTFICLMGVVSLFADMVQEGARSIFGSYLSFMGASAAMIGIITGAGELAGYSLRALTGCIAVKTGQYWLMTIVGYSLAVLAIPCLALVPDGSWVGAAFFIILGRMGKAIRQPAKSTLLSYAGSQEGVGKSFAIQEFLDQTGAFLGPVMLLLVFRHVGTEAPSALYHEGFALLLLPALCCIAAVVLAKIKFPHPEDFEVEAKKAAPFRMEKSFFLYMLGIGLFAFGFMDFPLITLHASRTGLVAESTLPLLYAVAMGVDAFAALAFGVLFDRYGIPSLAISTLVALPFTAVIFMASSASMLYLGVILWGIGMGAQESTLKAAVSTLVSKKGRAIGYGIFETGFGICWFIGSAMLGYLYDQSVFAMVVVSSLAQLLAVPFFLYCRRAKFM